MTTDDKGEPELEAAHDEAPSIITSHKFVPKGEWHTLCLVCNLAESAHAESTRHNYSENYHDHFEE